jgi:hypothetical protein
MLLKEKYCRKVILKFFDAASHSHSYTIYFFSLGMPMAKIWPRVYVSTLQLWLKGKIQGTAKAICFRNLYREDREKRRGEIQQNKGKVKR